MIRNALLGLVVVAIAALFLIVPGQIDQNMNRVVGSPPVVSARASALYERLDVVDLHADPLLWDRDLLERQGHGQVDLRRLVRGRVRLQVFGIVTQSPSGQNYERTDGRDFDVITALAIIQRWPLATWTSRFARADFQARKLHDAAERSAGSPDGELAVIRTRADLSKLLADRDQTPRRVGALLGLEGMHALDGDLANVDALFEAGVRMMAPTHFFDNAVGGSSAGIEKYGLTDFGRRAVLRAQELGVVLDVAHASPATLDDVVTLSKAPVVVSHTGVQATCPGPRNLSDAQVRAVARTRGVVGIGYWAGAVCGTAPADIARAIVHVRDLVGARHVALGSDFDGSVTTSFDTRHLAGIVDALLDNGLSEDEIRGVMGMNALRVLRFALPEGE